MKKHRGIICLETEWSFNDKKIKDPITSEPLLEFLKSYYGFEYIYRRVATLGELEYYLHEFSKKTFNKYTIFYFCFHGNTQCIHLEGDNIDLSLNKLINHVGNAFENKIIHFSSCRTLLGSTNSIIEFKKAVGARLVSGYTKSVDITMSAINDIAYFDQLQKRTNIGTTEKAMQKYYGDLGKELGFKVY